MDSKSPTPSSGPPRPSEGRPPPLPGMFLWVMLLVIGIALLWMYFNPNTSKLAYSDFLRFLAEDKIAEVKSTGDVVTGKFKGEPPKDKAGERYRERFRVVLPSYADSKYLDELLRKHKVEQDAESTNPTFWSTFLFLILPFLLLGVILWFFWRRTREQFNGAGFLGGFAKSPAKR
jgi:cell division protease FtsH